MYYRENGRTDKGTVISATPDTVRVRWDADGVEEEHEPQDVRLLPAREQTNG